MRFLIIRPTWILTSDDRDIPGTIPAKPGAVGAGVPNRSSVVCSDPNAASLLTPGLWRARYVQFFYLKSAREIGQTPDPLSPLSDQPSPAVR